MKYLFFDIECANCFDNTGKICEFGYVLTDACFNIVEQNEYIINPNDVFDCYVLDNMLAYPEHIYRKALDYRFFYEKIERLFKMEGVLCVGHTVDADAKYLNDEAKRYEKPYFNFKFYDAKEMYSSYANVKKSVGLEKISQEFGDKSRHRAHRAEDDALTTRIIVKQMCENLGCDLPTLIDLVEDCVGETCDGVIRTVVRDKAQARRLEREKNGVDRSNSLYGDNYIKFMQFLDGVQAQGEFIDSELNGKTLTITLNYQIEHFKEMLSIVQLLKNYNCTYRLKASECDYMVTKQFLNEDGTERFCTKSKYVEQAIASGVNIKIISFEELLGILNITEDTLSKMPFPDESCFLKRGNKKRKDKKDRVLYSDKEEGASIGELLSLQGLNIEVE
jgi:hypothetical protein